MYFSNMRYINVQFVLIVIVLSALLFRTGNCTVHSNLTSPCPEFFVYENNTEADDRWYGALTLLNEFDLNGVWLRVRFDKPVSHIRSEFGEVLPRDSNEYLIKDRNFKLLGNIPFIVRFYIQYPINEPPANFVGFRLNGRSVCPEVDVIATTTQRLFISDNETFKHSEDSDNSNSTQIIGENGVLYISIASTADNSNVSVKNEEASNFVNNSTLFLTNEDISKNNTITTPFDNSTNEVDNSVPQEEKLTLYLSN